MSVLPSPVPVPSRRSVLRAGAVGAFAALAPAGVGRAAQEGESVAPASDAPRRSVRLAHLTDIHVQPELGADAGLAQCLGHVQSHRDPVELILTGGDGVMDSFAVDPARSQMLVDLWRRVWQAECSLPVHHAIGNHDLRPWGKPGTDEPGARKWAVDMYGLPSRYYAVDRGVWRFLVLDSVRPSGAGYTSGLDEEQTAWLKAELAELKPGRFAAVLSHVPILTVTPLTRNGGVHEGGAHRVPDALMFADGAEVHALLRSCPGVKLCLSGHTHLLDRCEIDGIAYICGGAVSANWWKGNHDRVDEGYGLVDLYDDGSFHYAYTPFDWQVRPG